MQSTGLDVTEDGVMESIRIRDDRDTSRKESPLIQHPDAIVIDSTNLELNQVVQLIEDKLPKEILI